VDMKYVTLRILIWACTFEFQFLLEQIW